MNCRHGHPMVQRTAKKPPYGEFWGCTQYPTCTETRPIDADPALELLREQVQESIGATLKQGFYREKNPVPRLLKDALGPGDHWVKRLSEEQCHKVLKFLGEEQ